LLASPSLPIERHSARLSSAGTARSAQLAIMPLGDDVLLQSFTIIISPPLAEYRCILRKVHRRGATKNRDVFPRPGSVEGKQVAVICAAGNPAEVSGVSLIPRQFLINLVKD
jgi:hypothetical protein